MKRAARQDQAAIAAAISAVARDAAGVDQAGRAAVVVEADVAVETNPYPYASMQTRYIKPHPTAMCLLHTVIGGAQATARGRLRL